MYREIPNVDHVCVFDVCAELVLPFVKKKLVSKIIFIHSIWLFPINNHLSVLNSLQWGKTLIKDTYSFFFFILVHIITSLVIVTFTSLWPHVVPCFRCSVNHLLACSGISSTLLSLYFVFAFLRCSWSCGNQKLIVSVWDHTPQRTKNREKEKEDGEVQREYCEEKEW